MTNFLRDLSARHEALKKRIHSFRYPLTSRGLWVARVVYFTTPLLCGYALFRWTLSRRDANLGANNEKLLAAQAKVRGRPAGGRRVLE
jgi:hypothetical protein